MQNALLARESDSNHGSDTLPSTRSSIFALQKQQNNKKAMVLKYEFHGQRQIFFRPDKIIMDGTFNMKVQGDGWFHFKGCQNITKN